jgi:hypothetical protein
MPILFNFMYNRALPMITGFGVEIGKSSVNITGFNRAGLVLFHEFILGQNKDYIPNKYSGNVLKIGLRLKLDALYIRSRNDYQHYLNPLTSSYIADYYNYEIKDFISIHNVSLYAEFESSFFKTRLSIDYNMFEGAPVDPNNPFYVTQYYSDFSVNLKVSLVFNKIISKNKKYYYNDYLYEDAVSLPNDGLSLEASVNVGPDNILEASEKGSLMITMKNNTDEKLKTIKLSLEGISRDTGISFDHSPNKTYSLNSGESKTIEIPIITDNSVESGFLEFDVRLLDPYDGLDSGKLHIKIQTRKLGPKLPPYLAQNVSIDIGTDKILKALETGYLFLTVTNSGKGDAQDLKVSIKNISGAQGISFALPNPFSIKTGGSAGIKIPFTADETVKSGYFEFEVKVEEPNFGKNTAPVAFKIQTQELYKPQLVLFDWSIDDDNSGNSMGNGNGTIEAGEDIEFVIRIGNQGAGIADGVTVIPSVNGKDMKHIGDKQVYNVGDIEPGSAKDIKIPVSLGTEIGNQKGLMKLTVTDAKGYSVITPSFDFKVGQTKQDIQKFVVQSGKVIQPQIGMQIDAGQLRADVDLNIPQGKPQGKSAVAVVIGNKDYKDPGIKGVDYALNDAKVMTEYMGKTFGVNPANIIYRENADLTEFLDVFGSKDDILTSLLYKTVKTKKADTVYFYYSGHGVPGLKDKKGYLAPVSVKKNNTEGTAYSLDTLYANLSKLKEYGVKKIIVILDSCFSGDSESGMLVEGVSPIMVTVNNPLAAGELGTVFLATSGTSYAAWYPQMNHGLFTYFLLKGLSGGADTDKNKKITVGELHVYLSANVPDQSMMLKNFEQIPQVSGKPTEVIVDLGGK